MKASVCPNKRNGYLVWRTLSKIRCLGWIMFLREKWKTASNGRKCDVLLGPEAFNAQLMKAQTHLLKTAAEDYQLKSSKNYCRKITHRLDNDFRFPT